MNIPTIILGVASLALVVTYPLMKRITGYPQAFLGLTFNYGVLMASCATSLSGIVYETAIPLYVAGIAWTLVYDTIYALQDKRDDLASGKVHSTAITFGENIKLYLSGFASCAVGGFAVAGYMASVGPLYYLFGVAGPLTHFVWQIVTLKVDDVHDCWNKFVANQWVGGLVSIGIFLDTMSKWF
jgi:4-hydroxybenzoate polyprenyltransferase